MAKINRISKKNSIITENGFSYWTKTITAYGRVEGTFGPSIFSLPATSILEIGCSQGLTTKELLDLNPNAHVTAIDINPEVVAAAHTRCYSEFNNRVRFIVGDGYALGKTLKDEIRKTFGAIFAMNNIVYALYDTKKTQRDLVLDQLYTHLEENGHLYLSADATYAILDKKRNCKSKIIDESHHYLFYPFVGNLFY